MGVRYILFFLLITATGVSCKQVIVNEKLVDLPRHQWAQNQHAVIIFDINDSTSHQLSLIVRHTQQFPYNKLLVKLTIQDTAKQVLTAMNINAPLTNASGNWTGEIMDDIFYNRIKIMPPVFLKPGKYRFVLQHQMKETILPCLLNVGVAIDK